MPRRLDECTRDVLSSEKLSPLAKDQSAKVYCVEMMLTIKYYRALVRLQI